MVGLSVLGILCFKVSFNEEIIISSFWIPSLAPLIGSISFLVFAFGVEAFLYLRWFANHSEKERIEELNSLDKLDKSIFKRITLWYNPEWKNYLKSLR